MSANEVIRACELGDLVEVERLLPRVKNPEHVRSDRWSERTLLHYSCRHGWLDVTRRLVEQYHCDPESRDEDGDAALHYACDRGHVDIVRYLVGERGCSTACQNNEGDTPLLEACKTGVLAVAEILLTAEDCSTACNKHSRILLHYSCHHGWLDVTRKLVEQYHCDPESRGQYGDTLLHEACRKDHVDIVRYLVSELGCSTTCQNKYLFGDTPLLEACRTGRLAVVEILITAQDCSTACNKHSRILLDYSCHHGWLDVTRRLVEQYHCDPERRDGRGDTLLHEACRKDHVDIVRYLVSERGCSTACQNKDGDTPLLEACKTGRLAVAEILLTAQDCSTACNKHGGILLYYSYRHGWLDVTRRLVEQYHCDPESTDGHGDTLLHEACRKGHANVVRYLVSEQGCNTTCQNNKGNTPLLEACKTGRLTIVEILLTAQDCSTACNKHSRILLHYSCYHGWLDVTRRLVEQYRCDPESRDEHGDTLLHEACRKDHVDIVRYLVAERGCSTACQNKVGDTPLLEACRIGWLAVVEILITAQDCSTACNKHSGILLQYSCHNGWLDVTRRLVEQYHCDPESRDGDGYYDTPLYGACCEGHADIVRYLVSERGCSTACQNKDGDTPLLEACKTKRLPVVEILLTAQDCSTACKKHSRILLDYSCRHGWLDVTRKLVEQYHCDPESRDGHGDILLHEACRKGHADIVRYLVSERGCSTACQNKDGDTPLLEACKTKRLPVVEILLTAQDCSTACKKHSRILLDYSCHHGWLDVTRKLVEQYHCDPESRDGHGDTLLHEACRKGHADIVMYLVSEWGCSTASQDKDGNSPLHVACKFNRTDVVRILLASGRADPWFGNANNETPLQCSRNYTIAKLLAKFTGLSNDTIPTATKIFVFGNPAAGKSTLVKVIENKVTSRFGAFAGQLRNASGVEMMTAGISIVTIQSRRLGTITVYDLAGQFEYYSSHDALVGNLMSSSAAIFIVVVKLSESEAEVIRTLQYWISFTENCCSRVKATAHLIVIGSWADKVREAGEVVDQKWLNIKEACISSSSSLSFVGFAALDCRKLASSGLGKICDMIEFSCTALREAKDSEQKEIIYPHLLHAFIGTKLHTQVACSVGELCTHITAANDALLPTEPSLLSPLLGSLSDGGHLLYLPNKREFVAGWVIIDKQALLSEINGTIFAPDNFKQHHDIATSTGVVPKSKVEIVYAGKYSTDMILSVLTLFEFCHKIKDSFTLSLIADNDPSRDSDTAIATGDESSESYYFFPALVRVEHPTDVWQSSGLGEYRCGWCLQCSKEGQYLTPRFLQVLLLRLAFSFALVLDTSQQDRASPVLRRRCAVWKNGIQWLDQDGVETIVEVSEQNRVVLLLMLCPEGEEMACVRLRSSLISKVLEAKQDLCPRISTTELLIDPSNLSTYPLPSSSQLTLYSVADQVVKAVRECKPFILDTTGRKKLKLEKALHFEPYHVIPGKYIDRLFAKDLANQEVDDSLLNDLASNLHTKLMERIPIQEAFRMFSIPNCREFYSYCEQFPTERDNPAMRCFRLLLTWKKYAPNPTYQSLHTTLDKYSIFCGRNPVSYWLKLVEGTHFDCFCDDVFYMQISMVDNAGSSEAGGTSAGMEKKSTQ